jgi:hypothetical protein
MPLRALRPCALAALLLAPACSSGELARRTDRFDHDAATIETVRLSSTNGDLKVERRGDVERLELDVLLEVGGGSQEEAEERLRGTQVRTSVERGEMSAWVDFPAPRHELDLAHLVVRAPRPVGAVLKTANGAVHCTDLERAVDAHTRNGAVEIRGRHGDVLAQSVNGAVAITGALGRVKCETKNGGLSLELPDGAHGSFELVTENGAIEIQAPRSLPSRILLETWNGRVEVEGVAAPEPVVEGSRRQIRLALGTRAESFARARNGSVRCVLR